MAFTSYEDKEINCKIVLFGPKGAGKTANLQAIYRRLQMRRESKTLIDASQPHYFEFLPVHIGKIADFDIKLHLYSLPSEDIFETVHHVLLKGLDGFIFVVDSRIEQLTANGDALYHFRDLLKSHSVSMDGLAQVFQYNKRDLKDIAGIDVLRSELNLMNHPDQEAIATQSIGVDDTLLLMGKQVLRKLSRSHG